MERVREFKPRAGRITHVELSNERQVREVLANSQFFSREYPRDLPMFIGHGGKVMRYTINDRPAAFLAYIGLSNLLRLSEDRKMLERDSPLHILASNPSLLRDVMRDYPKIPPERMIYTHGIINVGSKTAGGAGESMLGVYHELASYPQKQPGLFFGFIASTQRPNVQSLRMALRQGYVIDSHAEVRPAGWAREEKPELVLRVVRPPVPIHTTAETKKLSVVGNASALFYAKAKRLLSDGFVGVGYDKKIRMVIFKKRTEARPKTAG